MRLHLKLLIYLLQRAFYCIFNACIVSKLETKMFQCSNIFKGNTSKCFPFYSMLFLTYTSRARWHFSSIHSVTYIVAITYCNMLTIKLIITHYTVDLHRSSSQNMFIVVMDMFHSICTMHNKPLF